MGLYVADAQILAERFAAGQALVAAHRADAEGRCTCGQPAPCPQAQAGAELCRRYRQWEPEAALVRPYVRPYVRLVAAGWS